MSEFRLYPINAGRVTIDKSSLTYGRGMGNRIAVPVQVFLITHPKGNIVVDTGVHQQVAIDPVGYWGEAKVKQLTPDVKPDENIVAQIKLLDYLPSDIRYLINTHLHTDHAGCNQHFTQSTVLVQKDELRAAFWPEVFQRTAYFRTDFDHPLKYEDLDSDYDVFGDGTIQIFRTPGHTKGHQSILVNLPVDGPFVLTGDACYMAESVNEMVGPGICWNAEEAIKSLKKLRHLRDQKGATLITGHDPVYWSQIKHAPEFYH